MSGSVKYKVLRLVPFLHYQIPHFQFHESPAWWRTLPTPLAGLIGCFVACVVFCGCCCCCCLFVLYLTASSLVAAHRSI